MPGAAPVQAGGKAPEVFLEWQDSEAMPVEAGAEVAQGSAEPIEVQPMLAAGAGLPGRSAAEAGQEVVLAWSDPAPEAGFVSAPDMTPMGMPVPAEPPSEEGANAVTSVQRAPEEPLPTSPSSAKKGVGIAALMIGMPLMGVGGYNLWFCDQNSTRLGRETSDLAWGISLSALGVAMVTTGIVLLSRGSGVKPAQGSTSGEAASGPDSLEFAVPPKRDGLSLGASFRF